MFLGWIFFGTPRFPENSNRFPEENWFSQESLVIAGCIAGCIQYLISELPLKNLASFPGLPRFYPPFAFTIMHRSGRPAF